MEKKFLSLFSGDGVKARAIRGTLFSVAGFGGGQAIRLASNLVLTRILFPEAFGLMALVQVFLTGLQMFSDMGLHPAIIQSKRGDEPAFLNTVWTMQIIRGLLLWLGACALTIPVAKFYDQEALLTLIPVLGVTVLITGFASTRVATAKRNLNLGRLTLVELGSQVFGTFMMILLALWLQSVWALVFGSLIIGLTKTISSHRFLPGVKNRLAWDASAFWEVFHFGKYLFFGTIAGFVILHGDRLILGKFASLEELAVYTIALMIATVPTMVNFMLIDRVTMPLYRNKPPAASATNYQNISKARFLILSGLILMTAVLAFTGELLIELLYDSRYHAAGPLLVLVSLSLLPSLITGGYSSILLANGNSRNFTILTIVLATVKLAFLIAAVSKFGLVGVIIAPVLVEFFVHPLRIYFIRPYHGWIASHDLGFGILAVLIAYVALQINSESAALLQRVFL